MNLGSEVVVASIRMCFTWYRKVAHLGHLCGPLGVDVVVSSRAPSRFDAQAALVPHRVFRVACVSHGTVSCYISDTSGEPSSRRSRREPGHKDIDASLVSCHLEWGSKATQLPGQEGGRKLF